MSEEGWKAFIAADGLDDWVVLHGGPPPAFRTASTAAAARLAAAVAGSPDFDGNRSALTIMGALLTVRLTRDLWGIEPPHIDLARAGSAIAREHGAAADRSAGDGGQVAIAGR